MNVSLSLGNVPINRMMQGGMLDATKEKMERRRERDNTVSFYENRISKLKDMKADSVEDVSRKLELFDSYQAGIAEAKKSYNHEQMFHVLDEAKERGKKIAEAAEDMKPKTAEERLEDKIEEIRGTDEKGALTESMEELAEMVEEMNEEVLEEISELTEELPENTEEISNLLSAGLEQGILQDNNKMIAYKPIDCYV